MVSKGLKPEHDGGEDHSAAVVQDGLVVAGGQAAPLVVPVTDLVGALRGHHGDLAGPELVAVCRAEYACVRRAARDLLAVAPRWCNRATVESTDTVQSSSPTAADCACKYVSTRSQMPSLANRLWCFHPVCHGPKPAGRSATAPHPQAIGGALDDQPVVPKGRG